MTSHQRRFLVAIPAALCLALSASTGALAAAAGDTKADYPSAGTPVPAAADSKADYPGTGEPPTVYAGRQYPAAPQARPAPHAGDTPVDYPSANPLDRSAPRAGDTPVDYPSANPLDRSAPRAGDTPVDYPIASRGPHYVRPTTTTVNRSQPAIVRDGDPTLPISLAIAALLLAGFATALARTRMQPRPSRS